MQLPAFYTVLRHAMSSRLVAAKARVSDTLRDNRVSNTAFFWFMWFMVVMATLTTIALWLSLEARYGVQTRYGRGHSLVRHVREDNLGFIDILHRILREIDNVFRSSRTIDMREREKSFGPVCPEIDIPGSDKNMTHQLNETSMFHAEKQVLRTYTIEARRLAADANKKLKKLYSRRRTQPSSMPTIPDTLNLGLEIDDYILLPGGHWVPAKCSPRWKVGIVIPFRDRHFHLPILLFHLVPFLKTQYLEFAIFVVEQANDLRFNRAMLMNVGFVEALNFTMFDCFIFHDVDHVPLSYGNYYGCSGMPRHFVSGVDRWKYRLLYGAFFGAVTGFTRTQIERFNGFPNVYWGWGGEDDDILGRIRAKGMAKTRPWGPEGFYNVIPHHHRSAKKNMDRVCLLNHYKQRVDTDGLNNLLYRTPSIELYPLYTNISVDIQELPWDAGWHVCDREAEIAAQRNNKETDVDVGKQDDLTRCLREPGVACVKSVGEKYIGLKAEMRIKNEEGIEKNAEEH